jgi:hypothetical protein
MLETASEAALAMLEVSTVGARATASSRGGAAAIPGVGASTSGRGEIVSAGRAGAVTAAAADDADDSGESELATTGSAEGARDGHNDQEKDRAQGGYGEAWCTRDRTYAFANSYILRQPLRTFARSIPDAPVPSAMTADVSAHRTPTRRAQAVLAKARAR